MAGPRLADRILDTTTTTGTGALLLSGVAPAKFFPFGSALASGDTCLYSLEHQTANEVEWGIGTYSSTGPTLSRTTVHGGTNGTAPVNLSAGTKNVYLAPVSVVATLAGLPVRASPASDDILLINNAAGTALAKVTVAALPAQSGRLLGVQLFTTTGAYTYTPTAGTTAVIIELQGAGGGGGGVAGATSGVSLGGPGGGGGYIRVRLTANFAGGTGNVGAKGTGGAAGANPGTNGGNTTFTTTGGSPVTYTAGGGVGGTTNTSGATPYALVAATGGITTNGDVQIPGGNTVSFALSTSQSHSSGSPSQYSRGGALVFNGAAASSAGSNAGGYGGGGSGAISSINTGTKAGGNGSDGLVVIWEYS